IKCTPLGGVRRSLEVAAAAGLPCVVSSALETSIGLAAGHELHTTVMPFILRSVSLRGNDSVSCPVERRTKAWQRLASDLPDSAYDTIGRIVGLDQVPQVAQEIIAGQVRGRVLIDPNL
ncbi:MAG: hypothetical protein P8Z39_01170, partial [Gammaproteobacteria bacterium]